MKKVLIALDYGPSDQKAAEYTDGCKSTTASSNCGFNLLFINFL